jgi:hypothetical protein
VEFQLTTDYNLVREILTTPDAYEHMGDDYAPPREAYVLNCHPEIRFLLASHAGSIVGLICLIPKNLHCWELHLCMLPSASAREKWETARGLAPWLAERTECKRLVAEAPRSNAPAIYYCTHGIGMKYVGTHREAFMKHGKLHDLVILGMGIGNGSVT